MVYRQRREPDEYFPEIAGCSLHWDSRCEKPKHRGGKSMETIFGSKTIQEPLMFNAKFSGFNPGYILFGTQGYDILAENPTFIRFAGKNLHSLTLNT